jgi:hypothetical protein
VDLPSAIDRLRKTTFRYSPALLKATLESVRTIASVANQVHGPDVSPTRTCARAFSP